MEEITTWDLFFLLKINRFYNKGDNVFHPYWIAPVGTATSFYRTYLRLAAKYNFEVNQFLISELHKHTLKRSFIDALEEYFKKNSNYEADLNKLHFEQILTKKEHDLIESDIEKYLKYFTLDNTHARAASLVRFDVQLRLVWEYLRKQATVWNPHFLEVSEKKWLSSLFAVQGNTITSPFRFLPILLVLEQVGIIHLNQIYKYGSFNPEADLVADFWTVANVDLQGNELRETPVVLNLVRSKYPLAGSRSEVFIRVEETKDYVYLIKENNKVKFNKMKGRLPSMTYKFFVSFIAQIKNMTEFVPIKLHTISMDTFGKSWDGNNSSVVKNVEDQLGFINQKIRKLGMELGKYNVTSGDIRVYDSLRLKYIEKSVSNESI